MEYNLSDHFDGKRFHNPGNHKMGDFKEIIKYSLSHKRPKWTYIKQNNLSSKKIDDFDLSGQIRYFHINHSTVLLQMDGKNILTDPVYASRASPVSFLGPKRKRSPGIRLEDLPRIDYVLLSHDHYDHLDLKALKDLAKLYNPMFLVGLGLKSLLKKNGMSHVEEMDWGDNFQNERLKFSFRSALHWSNRGMNPWKTLWGSFMIQGSSKIYFAGDTAYGSHFTQIKEEFGPADLALIPIGAFIPRSFMLKVHMDPQQAVQAHLDLGAKESFAIHWGTFQLTYETMFQPIEELEKELIKFDISNFKYDKEHGKAHVFCND